jgi:hypothetical protein
MGEEVVKEIGELGKIVKRRRFDEELFGHL